MEVQDLEPERPLYLERVGFRGVKRRVVIDSPVGEQHLDLSLDLYVDLYPKRRGVHLSRNIEALEKVLGASRSYSIEGLLRKLAKHLLAVHGYASRASVRAETNYYVELEFAGVKGVEPVEAAVEVILERGDGVIAGEMWSVEVAVKGFNVCPSAQATISSILGVGEGLPAPSHNQRVVLKGRVTTRKVMVRIEDVARALAYSLSAPSFTLLKRPMEARLVVEAHKRPRFAEDVVREAAYRIANLDGVPEDSIIEVEALSHESIHPHDLYAYLRLTAKEAREADSSEPESM